MEATLKDISVGPFRVVIAEFKEAGDIMPMHKHTGRGHLSVVAYGNLVSHVTGYSDVKLRQQSVAFWPLGTEHSWEAVEPSLLINIFIL